MLVDVLAREKNVPRVIVFGALEMALASATKKKYTEDIDVRVHVDRNTGAYETFRRGKVLPDDTPEWNRAQMLSVEEAQDKGKQDAKVEDVIEEPLPNVEFGSGSSITSSTLASCFPLSCASSTDSICARFHSGVSSGSTFQRRKVS